MFSSFKKLFTRDEMADLTQRRRQRRFSCFVPVMCTVEAKTEPAMIVDMAESGLRMVIRQKVQPGSVLKLHYNKEEGGLATTPSVNARVAWTRPTKTFYEVGVTCEEGPLFWVPPMLRTMSTTPDYTDVRQSVRIPTELDVAIAVHFGPSYVSSFIAGHLTDLSMGGAAFSGPVKAQVGTMVELRIAPPKGRSLTVKGRVVRQTRRSDGRTLHGLRFEGMTAATRSDLSRMLIALRTEAQKTAPPPRLPV